MKESKINVGVHKSWAPSCLDECILYNGMKYFQHNYCCPLPFPSLTYRNVYQFTCIKQNVPDNNEAHSALQNCGLWTLLHDTLLLPEFGVGFWMLGKFVDPCVTVMWDVMSYPDDGGMRFL